MPSILTFLREPVFEPETIKAMSAAFDEVCRHLKLNDDMCAREAIAVRIIELTQCGERDPERLRQRVLATECAPGREPR